MKTIIITFLMSILLSDALYAQDKLYMYCPNPEIDETACGYADANGNIIIPVGKYRYLYSEEFDKIAFVSLKEKQGIFAINRSEEILFEVYGYDNGPDYVSNGLFRIISNGKVGFANMEGQIIIKPRFTFAYPFQENNLAVFNENGTIIKIEEYSKYEGGKWGVINKKEEVTIPAIYEEGKRNQLKEKGKWYNINELKK